MTALAERHDLAITAVNERSDVLDQPQIVERDLFPDADHWRPLGRVGRSLKIETPTGTGVSTERPFSRHLSELVSELGSA